jgi:hypothetical protein
MSFGFKVLDRAIAPRLDPATSRRRRRRAADIADADDGGVAAELA